MDLQKSKLVVIIPIVVSILAATFGSVRYIINLTDTIEANNQQVILLNKDIQIIFDKYAQDKEEKRKRTDDDLFNEIMKIEHKKQMELKKNGPTKE